MAVTVAQTLVVLGLFLLVACVVTLATLIGLYGDFVWSSRRVVRRGQTEAVPVPRITHQTWKSKETLRPYQKRSMELLQRDYPDYEHRFWSDADIEAFAAREFPEFHADTWQRLKPFIKKVDTVRYMILYRQGGIYFDIDFMSRKSIAPLLDVPGAAYAPARHSWFWFNPQNHDAASPALLASAPGNPFWLCILDYIREHHTPEYLAAHTQEEVVVATGPCAVAHALKKFQHNGPPLVLLSETRMGLGGLKFLGRHGYHENRHGETWRDAASSAKTAAST